MLVSTTPEHTPQADALTTKNYMQPNSVMKGVFPATLMWDNIVSHLEKTLKCSRHRHHFRSYYNCFSGSKAVKCLVIYLRIVMQRSITKKQAQALCEQLLITDVIENVSCKNKDVRTFKESRLYRFTGYHFWEDLKNSQESIWVRHTHTHTHTHTLTHTFHASFYLCSTTGWTGNKLQSAIFPTTKVL